MTGGWYAFPFASLPEVVLVKRLFVCVILLACAAAAQQPPAAAPGTQELTIENIFAEGGVTGRAPESVQWSPDGAKVSFVQRDDAGARGDLWYVDLASGRRAVLVPAKKMATLKAPTKASEEQKERRERYSVEGYQWAPDSKHLLFDADGFLWAYSLDSGTAVQITQAAEPASDPKFSPDGKLISYVRKHNLYVQNVVGGAPRALTKDTDENLLNGEVDWVYEEELEVRSNYFWSPDGKEILFLQMDETQVPTYPIVDWIALPTKTEMQKYPKPGDPNPVVRVGVVKVAGGSVRWAPLPIPKEWGKDYYIPRFGWVKDRIVWAQVLNRAQNELHIYFIDLASGKTQLMLKETSEDWVEVSDDFRILKSGSRFLWSNWRDGFTHLYLYSFDKGNPLLTPARLERQLTKGEFETFGVKGVDEANAQVYLIANANDLRQRQLYRVKLDGTEPMQRVSQPDGTHTANFDETARHYVDTYSNQMFPAVTNLCTVGASCTPIWEPRSVAGYHLLAPKFVEFRAEDGTALYATLLIPPNAAGKVPLILSPYGGPGAQAVRDAWNSTDILFGNVLAQHGFATLIVDNRGTKGRGRKFTAVLKRNLGEMEVRDQMAALEQALAQYPQLDRERVGFWGWSYGGTMTLWALTRTTAFKAGVAVAPVTDWRLYDSIYTERYMGLPKDNEEGYKKSAAASTAAGLHGALLEVHGTGDDNVHVQNTMQMVQAFIDAGKQFELMLYPRKTHGISGPVARDHVFHRILDHFDKNLKGAQAGTQ